MDPEIRDAIKKQMLKFLEEATNYTASLEAARILIDMERASESHALQDAIALLQRKVALLEGVAEALKGR